MSTKELIKAEIEKLDEDELTELYEIIKDLTHPKSKSAKSDSLMSKLKRISIDAPPDFSSKADLYLDEGDDGGQSIH